MTGQEFVRYLEQPDQLIGLPMTELQQLAVRFPHSTNLRLLLLLKTHLEGHPEEAAYLARCAASSFDRASIYDTLRELDVKVNEASELDGDVLELRELDDLMLEELPLSGADASPNAAAIPEPLETESLRSGWEVGEDELSGEQPPVDTEVVLPELEGGKNDVVDPPTSNTPVPPNEAQQAAVSSYGSLQQRLARIRERQRAQGFGEKEDVNRIARRSLVAQEEVASETLAKLLIRQGQYQHAIKMYRRLILLYPEKKPTFAALIKELKEKL
ncbi:MAG: hypothetical protein AAF597_16140 [Bacteroidota bacterium]